MEVELCLTHDMGDGGIGGPLSLDMQPYGCFIFLAHLVMSLCNHALSIVWCCHLLLALALSVYSSPSDSFDHRNFISCKYM